jgi:hypothetical protein
MRVEEFTLCGEPWVRIWPYGPDSVMVPLTMREFRRLWTLGVPILERHVDPQRLEDTRAPYVEVGQWPPTQ